MNSMKELKRDTSLDLVRIFATFSVCSIHFFSLSGLYSQPFAGKRMLVTAFMCSFFKVCVPLFLILTGYLMSQKTLSKKYFSGISKTLIIYVLASIACICYKYNCSQWADFSIRNAVFSILNFTGAKYSWYIEMYIGLFLLIPFLNLTYHHLNNRREKRLLLIILLFLTAAPSVFNIYNFTMEDWWLTPSISAEYQKLIPSWWTNIYPITYYFIGCYLKEYGFPFKPRTCCIILIPSVLLIGTFSYYRSYNVPFIFGPWDRWESLLIVIMTTLVFCILAGLKCSNRWPSPVRYILKWLSDFTLGAYLVSYIFDNYFYSRLCNTVAEVPHRLERYFVVVPVVFMCSLALSFVLNVVYVGIMRGVKYIFHILKTLKEKCSE